MREGERERERERQREKERERGGGERERDGGGGADRQIDRDRVIDRDANRETERWTMRTKPPATAEASTPATKYNNTNKRTKKKQTNI